mmetsp:Transcript_35807/g.94891  ORF Transcript_35807/g.94891 Transcript_35807/m.94891 type:complete len:167 (-) Transcript_35807:89-589(-)
MEPTAVFDGDGAVAATWVQTHDAVSITVPVPASMAGSKPEVVITQRHVSIRFPPAFAGEGAGSAPTVLLDDDLGGEVSLDESAWTVTGCTLMLELVKRPDYGSAAAAAAPSGKPKLPWWPCAVCGGKKGPEDPTAPKGPMATRLDSKIGEQVTSKANFQGKSKFQW